MLSQVSASLHQHSREVASSNALKQILVAHDGSPAAALALEDGVALANRFQAELVIAHVQPPDEYSADTCKAPLEEKQEIERLTNQIAAQGVRSRGIVRRGNVGDTLFSICCEEGIDLLMLGAYGRGAQDRQTLGSTAEHLLRAVPCPTLTYGPSVVATFCSGRYTGPTLVPVCLPCSDEEIARITAVAKLLDLRLELLHVADPVRAQEIRKLERDCEFLASRVRYDGLKTQWALLFGDPKMIIPAQSSAMNSPAVLMPLHWGKHLSSISSDSLAAHVIRCSRIPVITYRVP